MENLIAMLKYIAYIKAIEEDNFIYQKYYLSELKSYSEEKIFNLVKSDKINLVLFQGYLSSNRRSMIPFC